LNLLGIGDLGTSKAVLERSEPASRVSGARGIVGAL